MQDITARTELVEITGICDTDLDEHGAKTWTATRTNDDDLITEVRHECHCGKGYWVPLAAARAAGYTA
jgi:hypothetical protein